MGAITLPSTIPGGLTPICNDCGITLCWDIDETTYQKEQAFWDGWRCEDCNPNAKGARARWRQSQPESR